MHNFHTLNNDDISYNPTDSMYNIIMVQRSDPHDVTSTAAAQYTTQNGEFITIPPYVVRMGDIKKLSSLVNYCLTKCHGYDACCYSYCNAQKRGVCVAV